VAMGTNGKGLWVRSMTKVSEILSMSIPANKLIQIMNWDYSARSISKARRDLGRARLNVGWDDHVEVSKDQRKQLESWHMNTTAERMKMEQEREYFDALEKWSIAMHQNV
jgi:hypothetical protein